jgi:CHAT domain-containing protein/tetratricopeptide (TPR) repeat protein
MLAIAFFFFFAARSYAVGAPGDKEFVALADQIESLEKQGKLPEAVALAEKLWGQMRAEGLGNAYTVLSMGLVAKLYQKSGNLSQAELLYKQLVPIYESGFGPDHEIVATTISSLANLYRDEKRYSEAEALYSRALRLRESKLPPYHPDVIRSLLSLGYIYQIQGRYREAEQEYKRVLDIRGNRYGPANAEVGETLGVLANLYARQGRYQEAEDAIERWIEILQKAKPVDAVNLSGAFGIMGSILHHEGKYDLAEVYYKRALSAGETSTTSDSYVNALNGLAILFKEQGRSDEAEALLLKTLALRDRKHDPQDAAIGQILTNLGSVYEAQGRFIEAEEYYNRALKRQVSFPTINHLEEVANLQNNLAGLLVVQQRFDEAEPLYSSSLDIILRSFGRDHPKVGDVLNNLAAMRLAQGRYEEAETLFNQSLSIAERTLGANHRSVIETLSNLAYLRFVRRDWAGAVDYGRRGAKLITTRIVEDPQGSRAGVGQVRNRGASIRRNQDDEAARFGIFFSDLIKAANRLSVDKEGDRRQLLEEMFVAAQRVHNTAAAAALTQMAVRGASANVALAALIRERQDLTSEWQQRDQVRIAALYQLSDPPVAGTEAENKVRLSAIETRVHQIDQTLGKDFPEFADFSNPSPLSVGEVQSLLSPDEAMVVFLDTEKLESIPEETFIWVVTKMDARWVRSDLGTPALAREVRALRCGLDYTEWDAPSCRELTGQDYSLTARRLGKSLPFDLNRAHRLYDALFGLVEDLIKGKSLLIVPSGPLTQLPFQVLVTEPPKGEDYRAAAWLIREHALAVLPAATSLKALRRVARPSSASKPMIGFGNPLLAGNASDPADGLRAQRAVSKQRCQEAPWPRTATLIESGRGVAPLQTRGGLADVSVLRAQAPLPETADELCAVARDIGADISEIRLGASATEREAKHLSKSGLLAQYRIVHFATHGALAGEVQDNAEPGLLLTPPDAPSEEDDGYLTSSEIAALKLDADWVILSACNTAAGGAEGAEALSGLARAFFYAQARALLVSHWEVDSNATVKLITGAIQKLSANKSIGRAEALRQTMLALIDKGEPQEAHPALWAPFVVVGEGGAASPL